MATVRLSFPFRGRVGDIVWSLFETSDAVWNGYDEAPEALASVLVVKLRIINAEMVPPPAANERASALAAVEVSDIVLLDDLLRSTPRAGPIHQNWAFYVSRITRASLGDWRFISSDAEGDIEAFAIWHEQNGAAALLMTRGSGHHESFFAAGNRRLSADDMLLLAGGTR